MNMDKLIINAAITGMIPMKRDNENVPITLSEIIADVRRCRDAGASIVHIHARDEMGQPTYKKEVYYEIFTDIHEECPDIIICGSASGRRYKEFWQRTEVLAPGPGCKPELASLTLGSLNFPKEVSVNSPDMILALLQEMNRNGIVPELEVFDLGMVDYAHYLIEKGFLQKPYYFNILLGSLGTLSATPQNLVTIVHALPKETVWSATGIGKFQFFMNSLAITMGGHVRVGLEDNLFYDKNKTMPASNPGLIKRVVKVAHAVGREIASPDEARQIIGLKKIGVKRLANSIEGIRKGGKE